MINEDKSSTNILDGYNMTFPKTMKEIEMPQRKKIKEETRHTKHFNNILVYFRSLSLSTILKFFFNL